MDSGSQASPASATPETIDNGMNDIARTVHQEKMRVQANGRRTFQQVYLWIPHAGNPKYGSGSTTALYQPEVDGPSRTPCPIMPRDQELVDHADAKLYLEVGIVIGADPTKYEAKGTKNKQRDMDRQRRGILPRDDGAMRVFTPVTENIAPQAKFYVGCRFTEGRLFPCVIHMDNVFFYPEFWRGTSNSLSIKQCKAELAMSCKLAAAINKSPQGDDIAPAAPSGIPRVQAADATPTKQTQELEVIRSEGADAFFNFDEPLSGQKARSLALDLMKANSHIGSLQYELIMSMHQVLCTGSTGPTGEQLEPKTLGTLDFFIRDCQQRIPILEFDNQIVIRKAGSGSLASFDIIMQNPFWKHLQQNQ